MCAITVFPEKGGRFRLTPCASPKPRSGLGDGGCGMSGDALLCEAGVPPLAVISLNERGSIVFVVLGGIISDDIPTGLIAHENMVGHPDAGIVIQQAYWNIV